MTNTKYVKTTLNFESEEERQKYKDFALDKGYTFSGLVKNLLDNAMRSGSPSNLNNNEALLELQRENRLLKREIELMREEFSKQLEYMRKEILFRLTKRDNGKLDNLKESILEFLETYDSKGHYKKFSLTEIANYLNTTEQTTNQALDSLIEAKKIRLDFNTTKYVKVRDE